MKIKQESLDTNLKIFKFYSRSCYVLDLSGAVCILFVMTPALIIFFNPISAIAWLIIDAVDASNPNATREHDALENTIKYNLFVTLPLAVWTSLIATLYFCSKYLLVSSKKRFLLAIAHGRRSNSIIENLYSIDSFYIDIQSSLCKQAKRLYTRDYLAQIAESYELLEMFKEVNAQFDTLHANLVVNFNNKKQLPLELIIRIVSYLKVENVTLLQQPTKPKYLSLENIHFYGSTILKEYDKFLQKIYGSSSNKDKSYIMSMKQTKDLIFGYEYFRTQKLLSTPPQAKTTALLEDDIESQISQLRRPLLSPPAT